MFVEKRQPRSVRWQNVTTLRWVFLHPRSVCQEFSVYSSYGTLDDILGTDKQEQENLLEYVYRSLNDVFL